MELLHIDPYVQAQLYKLASADLCSNVVGQIMTSLMLRPPIPGDESYELFKKENDTIFNGLKERSQKLVEGLNSIPGITCVPAEGAMYAFPRVEVPEKAIQKAKEMGTTPDNLYALSLLEETGICVVPASGFGQAKGRGKCHCRKHIICIVVSWYLHFSHACSVCFDLFYSVLCFFATSAQLDSVLPFCTQIQLRRSNSLQSTMKSLQKSTLKSIILINLNPLLQYNYSL